MIEASRRSLLIGLGSLIVAPAIVRATNIMPVKTFDPYYTRYLLDYLIGSDEMAFRVDRALHPLKITKHMHLIPAHIVHDFIPEGLIKTIKPIEGQQKYITHILTSEEATKIMPNWQEIYD